MENNINSKEKLIAYLSLIRDQETEKPLDEADNDLIKACVELLLELQGKEVTLSTEDIEELVRKIPFADTEMIKTVNAKGKVRKFKKKKILLIAAVIAILVAILSIVSIAFEWNIFDALKDKFGTVANAPAGVEQQENGITFYRLDKNKKYKSIEDALEQEDIDILFTRNIPNGLSFRIIKVFENNGIEEVFISFSDENLSCEIKLNSSIPNEVFKIYNETIDINNLKCYVIEKDDASLVQIYFSHNNNTYIYTYNDKQVLLEIIEKLEEQ